MRQTIKDIVLSIAIGLVLGNILAYGFITGDLYRKYDTFVMLPTEQNVYMEELAYALNDPDLHVNMALDQHDRMANALFMTAVLNGSMPQLSDEENYGMRDYWAKPSQFFQRGGDCEDFAIAKYAIFRAFGVPARDLRIDLVHAFKYDEVDRFGIVHKMYHAILQVKIDGVWYILDNLNDEVMEAPNKDYEELYYLNEEGIITLEAASRQ